MGELLLEAFGQTLVMVVPSTIFSVIFGFIIAIVLVVTDSNGLFKEQKYRMGGNIAWVNYY